MDHLPQVTDGNLTREYSSIKVPHLVPSQLAVYELRGVDTFLRYQAESLEQLRKEGRASKTPPSFFQSFLAKPTIWTQKRNYYDDEWIGFTQYILWFGLLAETFAVGKIIVDLSRFITKDGPSSDIITSFPLTEYFCYWHLAVDKISEAEKTLQLNKLHALFSGAAVWLNALSARICFLDPPPSSQLGYPGRFKLGHHHASYPRANVILLSVRILCETLLNACKSVYSTVLEGEGPVLHIKPPRHPLTHFVFVQEDFDFVDRLMLDAGWCPNEIAVLAHRSSLHQNSLRYFMCQIDRRRAGRDHSRCDRHRCYRLTEYPYYPKHVREGCDCPKVFTQGREAEPKHIVEIVRRGLVPLIRIRNGAAVENLLEVTSYDPASDPESCPTYIAISHVWSDGMGNRDGNYLPACQIRLLQSRVNYARTGERDMEPSAVEQLENVPFWIDTLCIPRCHKKERNRAMRSMADVYRNAKSVLVLDKSLLNMKVQSAGIEECLTAITQSTWSQRLWTLQEARMTKSLHFEFANGFMTAGPREPFFMFLHEKHLMTFLLKVHIQPVFAEIARGGWNSEEAEMLLRAAIVGGDDNAKSVYEALGRSPEEVVNSPEIRRFYQRMCEYWFNGDISKHATRRFAGFLASLDPELPQSARFLLICEEVQLRRTTEAYDEAVTMSSLLDADVQMVLDTDGPDRMAALLRSLQFLPPHIVFFQGERYQKDGMKWIPASFLLKNGRLGNIWGNLQSADLPDVQAQPQPDGLLVKLPGVRLCASPDSTSLERCYLIHGTSKFVVTLTEGNKLRLARTDWTRYAGQKLAVMLSTSLKDTRAPAWGGVLVSTRKTDAGVHYVRFEHHVYIHRAQEPLKTRFGSILIDWPGESRKEPCTQIEILPESHSWCLG